MDHGSSRAFPAFPTELIPAGLFGGFVGRSYRSLRFRLVGAVCSLLARLGRCSLGQGRPTSPSGLSQRSQRAYDISAFVGEPGGERHPSYGSNEQRHVSSWPRTFLHHSIRCDASCSMASQNLLTEDSKCLIEFLGRRPRHQSLQASSSSVPSWLSRLPRSWRQRLS